MKKKPEKIVDAIDLDEDALFELANVQPRDTGLRYIVWISDNSYERHHTPRMKVEGNDKRMYPVSFLDPIEFLAGWPPGWTGKDFQDLQRFIILNRNIIMGHWNQQIDSKDALNQIRSI